MRASPYLVRGVALPLVLELCKTWRIDTVGIDYLSLSRQPHGYVLVTWHEVLLPLLWYHRDRGVTIVTSSGQDGYNLSLLAERLGYHTIFGSSSRRGVNALMQSVKALRNGAIVAFTPDGPRGPRRGFKAGAVAAAKLAGVPVLAMYASTSRAWRLSSWDKFVIPKPWSHVRIGFAEPFMVDADQADLTDGMSLALKSLTAAEEFVK